MQIRALCNWPMVAFIDSQPMGEFNADLKAFDQQLITHIADDLVNGHYQLI